MNIITLVLLLLSPQDTFTQFTYCRENSRGTYESQCVRLDPVGSGEIQFKRRTASEVRLALTLSPAAKERFIAVLAGTNFLSGAEGYESKRKVADLGRKRLTLEMPSGRREAEFNYSDLKEVNALVTFFEAMLNQETTVFDIDMARQLDRLSIPKRLDELERELKANRLADPPRLIPVLERIETDQRVVNYAREHARKLKEQAALGNKK